MFRLSAEGAVDLTRWLADGSSNCPDNRHAWARRFRCWTRTARLRRSSPSRRRSGARREVCSRAPGRGGAGAGARDGRAAAALVLRLERVPLSTSVGYATLYSPRVRSLTLVHGGEYAEDAAAARLGLGRVERSPRGGGGGGAQGAP